MLCSCRQTTIQLIDWLIVKNFKYIFFPTLLWLLLTACQSGQAETYWLERVETPEKVSKNGPFPIVSDPRDLGYLTAITIDGDRILMNGGDGCDARVKSIHRFSVGRPLADAIDYAGGQKRFDDFLLRRLRTKLTNWEQSIIVKESDKNIESEVCQLIMRTVVFKGKKELVLWDTTYFYKFELGDDYDKAFKKK